VDDLRQAALQQAPAESNALAGPVEVDETQIACRSKNDLVTGDGGRSHQGNVLVVGAVEVEDGGLGPGRIRQVADYSATSLHAFLAANLVPGATAKTDGWPAYRGAGSVTHDPMSSARLPPTSCSLGFTGSSPTSRSGPRASITGCAASTR
jgi:hypothetical protein